MDWVRILVGQMALWLVCVGCVGQLTAQVWRDSTYQFELDAQPWQLRMLGLREFLPGEASCGTPAKWAHNNTDLVEFQGTYYLVLRVAPTHFPSRKTELQFLKSQDLVTWECIHRLNLGADIREPRFLVWGDTLYLYCFEGGRSPIRFQPRKLWGLAFNASSGWSEPFDTGLDGWVPWRIRVQNGIPYLSAYYGVGLYSGGHDCEIRLFTTQDARHWHPISQAPQVKAPAAEEGEFVFAPDGTLWATVRLEGGGALLATASGDYSQWTTQYLPQKFDSALLLEHQGEIFLIARRNVDGDFAKKSRWLPRGLRNTYNLVRYSFTRKRTALYHIHTQSRQITPVLDLPGWGDTAFPALLKLPDGRYYMVNYSSPLAGRDRSWIGGQLRPTRIYEAWLEFVH